MMIRRKYFRSLGVISSLNTSVDVLGCHSTVMMQPPSIDCPFQILRERDIKASYFMPLGAADKVNESIGQDILAESPTGVTQISELEGRHISNQDQGSKVSNKRVGVSFNPRVKVVPIPGRNSYSSRVREVLWNSADSLMTHVERNIVEYTYDGWYWRNCSEEEDMFVCSISGETIHPAHVYGYNPSHG